jgi:hypothetical protein
MQNACSNLGRCSETATATCSTSGNTVEVRVSLRPIRVFGGLRFGVDRVIARARSSPRYGINAEE